MTKEKIYYSENIDEKYPLASLTKMMTLMVTFDQLEKGNIKMKDKIKVSKKICSNWREQNSYERGRYLYS